MTLAPGQHIGPFEVTARLGEGGMGVVWRARDSRLSRDVALKVLPAEVASDAERRARFEREATVLAKLSHPNVAGIHGLEAEGDTLALVMELVEGPTLDERLREGPLPLEEALAVARQIASALEEAHDRSVVHRDLKPQNIKAPLDGTVKVLDFGLAKAMDATTTSDVAVSSLSPTFFNSPTLTAAGTQAGVILGTAPYMAPEQARGVAVDRRADIWSFGVVFFEMLTGRRLFSGELVTDVLANVLRQDVDFDALPAETPPAIRRLLRRCLQRRPKDRLRDIGDARLVIDEVLSGQPDSFEPHASPPATSSRQTPWLPLAAAGLLLLGAGWLIGRARGSAPTTTPREVRFSLAMPEGQTLDESEYPNLALSPDARRQVVTVRDENGTSRLLVRDLDAAEPWILAGTEDGYSPFFSPDGQWIGFFAPRSLMKIAVGGGSPIVLAALATNPRGATWSRDGFVYFAPESQGPLQRVSENGGAASAVLALDDERAERTQRWPSALPDGSAVLFTSDSIHSTEYYDDATIDAVRPATGERLTLVEGSSQARFFAPDRLLYSRGGTLFSVRLDPRTLEVSGSPQVALTEVATDVNSGAVQFAVSETGSVLWSPGNAVADQREMRRFAPDMRDLGTVDFLPVAEYRKLAISPDGVHLALAYGEPDRSGLWIANLQTQSLMRRTFGGEVDEPVWTPDGQRIAFTVRQGAKGADVYWASLSGGEDPDVLYSSPGQATPFSFSRDGRSLVLARPAPMTAARDPGNEIFVVDIGGNGMERSLGKGFHSVVSPSGRWLAYISVGVFVRPFPEGEGRWQIAASGFEPRWAPDEKHLYYRLDNVLWRVPIELGETVRVGKPVASTIEMAPNGTVTSAYDIGPDGTIWAAQTSAGEVTAHNRLHLITNWALP